MPNKTAVERLEALIEIDKKASQTRSDLARAKDELREVKAELKKLKALDPVRLKKNLADQKKKMVLKNTEINAQRKELLSLRKLLREAKSELNASQNETDAFYVSSCKRWELFFTGFRYPGEGVDPDSTRVRCLDRKTGTSVVARALDGNKAQWSFDIGIPEEISEEAAARILSLELNTSPSD